MTVFNVDNRKQLELEIQFAIIETKVSVWHVVYRVF